MCSLCLVRFDLLQLCFSEGFLMMVEYMKREAEFIMGTPLVWLPSDRDFHVPSCFPVAVLYFRDPNKAEARRPTNNNHQVSSRRDRDTRGQRETSRLGFKNLHISRVPYQSWLFLGNLENFRSRGIFRKSLRYQFEKSQKSKNCKN